MLQVYETHIITISNQRQFISETHFGLVGVYRIPLNDIRHQHTSFAYIPTDIMSYQWPTTMTAIASNAQGLSVFSIRWAGLLALFIVLSLVLYSFTSSFLRLRHFPGPWWAAHSRLWLLEVYLFADPPASFIEVNKNFGRHYGNTISQRRQQRCRSLS